MKPYKPQVCPRVRGAFAVALSTVVFNHTTVKRVELDNMVDGAVRPHERIYCRIRVLHGNLLIARIACLFGCPIEKRNVEHAVDDCPASCVTLAWNIVPSTDKATRQIEASGQQVGGMQRSATGVGIARHFIIRHAGRQPHKAHIMVQPVKLFEASVEPIFRDLSDFLIFLVARLMIHEPQHAAPKAVRPKVDPVLSVPLGLSTVRSSWVPLIVVYGILLRDFSLTQSIFIVIFEISSAIQIWSFAFSMFFAPL